jgi:hypothetical protein
MRARTRCQRYRGRRLPYSCFVLSDSFSTVPRASAPVFTFCALGNIFGGTVGVGFRYQVLCDQTHFRWYRGRLLPFSCFASPDSFSSVPRASAHVFMFCDLDSFSVVPRASGPISMFSAPGLISHCTAGIGSHFNVLLSRTRVRRYRGRRVPFSCFALSESFSAVPRASGAFFIFCAPLSFSAIPRASGPAFLFCAPGLVFDGTEGVGSRFHILCPRTHFRRYRGRRVPFSSLARPYSFSALPRALGPDFMLCTPGLIFSGTEGVGSRVHVLRAQTLFRRYRGRWIPFTYFAVPDSFSAVPRASGPVFMFCAPRLVSDVSRPHVLRARTHFRRFRGRRVSFSYYARTNSFPAVPRASGPVFKFCAPRLVFGGTARIGSRFHVLRARTHFRRYRGHRLSFSYFARPDSFSAVPRASSPVLICRAPGLIFDGNDGVGIRFHVSRAWTSFPRYRGRQVPFSSFALLDSCSIVPRTSRPVFMLCAS